MRIATVRPEGVGATYLAGLLSPLLPHLRSCEIPLEDLDLNRPSRLVIEDFETTGLTGAWDSEDAIGGWYDFFRNFGASHKTGGRGGRWGLGKLVFTSASRVRAFFALTVRAEDDPPRPLIMGQAVLKAHKIDDARYDSHGFFARSEDAGELQLPVENLVEVARFVQACNLTRSQEPGLSIIIPFPSIEHKSATIGQELARHLLVNFFFPILSGDLVADVDGAEISAETFDTVVRNFGGEELHAGNLAAFVREMKEARERHPDVVLGNGWYGAIESAMPPRTLEDLRLRYATGGFIYARFPIQIRPRGGNVRSTSVEVFIRKTKPGEKAASICARGMLTVPGEAKSFFADGCFVGLVASDEAITSFLGDAEGPSHRNWNAREQKVRTNWYNADTSLRLVRNAPRQLYTALAAMVERTEERALVDEFWIPKVADSHPDTPARDTRKPRDEVDPPPPRLRRFVISRRPDGFAIAAGPGLQDSELPLRLRVRAAYDVMRGDPFKGHSSLDFDLASRENIDIDLQECRIERATPSSVVVEATSTGFKASFTGFDANRDLVVDARRVE